MAAAAAASAAASISQPDQRANLDVQLRPQPRPRSGPQIASQLPAVQRSTQVDTLDRPARPERPTPDRFLDVLNAAPTSSLRPLPSIFAPMAQAVVGRTDVMVRDDSGARAALAAVGKRAATMGNTIVLPDRAGAATDTAVLAHELTHIAHPSPLPRFYADDRPSAEERQADAVAQLIHRSPALRVAAPAIPAARQGRPRETAPNPMATDHSSPTTRPTAVPHATPTMLRRSAAPARPGVPGLSTDPLPLTPPPPRYAAAPPATPGHTISAATATRGSRAHRSTAVTLGAESSGGTVRRAAAPARSSPTARRSALPGAGAAAVSATPIRRALAEPAHGEVSGVQDENKSSPIGVPIIDNMTTTAGVVEFVDWIVEKVEDRVIAELQRRGGRFKEDF